MKSAPVLLGLCAFVILVVIACDAGKDKRRFEWDGLTFNAGMELHHFVTPLDEKLVSDTAKSGTVKIRNNGSALWEFGFSSPGPPPAGRIYYWVDGREDGVCDEKEDIVGFKQFPEGELTTTISFNYDAASPDGVCQWFGAGSLAVSTPTPAPTPTRMPDSPVSGQTPEPTATPTVTPTPLPDWVSIHGDGPFNGYLEYLDAYAAFDIVGAKAASTADVHSSIESLIEQEQALLSGDSGFWRRFVDVTYDNMKCTEFRCEFDVEQFMNTPYVQGLDRSTYVVMRLDGEKWKIGADD